jgi:pyridoxal phosphate enzyme (YggS family)
MADLKRKLTENIRSIQERIAQACHDANRDPSEVRLVAVTKYVGIDIIKLMVEAGLTDLGESRAQELTKRAAMVNEFLSRRARDVSAGAMPRPAWHMVGHVQRNKVKSLLPWVDMIHSVDSLRLAEDISSQAGKLGRKVDVLMQVNAGGEPSKFGVSVGAATHLAELIAPLPNISVCGLMTMAPLTEDRGRIYDCFMRCRELFDEIYHEVGVGEQFRHLSMGMTHDFEVAIACGATMVRIGTALFENLPLPDPAATESSET